MKLSAVLDKRLDDLVAMLNREGNLVGRLYRHDLIAALIALAPETGDELEKMIGHYQAMTVRDALLGAEKDAQVIELRPARPGRRTL